MAMAPAPLPSLGLILQPSYVVTGEAASFAWTGIAANLVVPGTLGQSDNPAPLPSIGLVMTRAAAASLTAEAGAFSFDFAPSESDLDLSAQVGDFVLTGQAAGTVAGRLPLTASAGTFTMVGMPAVLAGNAEYRIDGEAATFSLAGIDAVLSPGRVLAAAGGSFDATGNAADTRRGISLSADAGSFVASGIAASLNRVSVTSRYGRRRRRIATVIRRVNRLI